MKFTVKMIDDVIDPIKDISAILAWVQNYWGERAVKAYF